jgi:hypothetical protein
MAGSVVVLHRVLLDLRVRRASAFVLAAGFALQPMIVMYGGNGMSEASFLFFLLLATRRLSSWLAMRRAWDLVLAGSALAFAYLTRIEAIPAVMAATAVVCVVSAVTTTGDRRVRIRIALLHGFLLAAPAAFAFVIWSIMSWVITGHPFEQISSQYGTASQITAGGDSFDIGRGGIAAPRYLAMQLAGLAPLLPLALLAAGWTAFRRRDLRLLAPGALMGGVVLFELLAFLRGQTVGNLRYLITAIPLFFVLVGCTLGRRSAAVGRWPLLRSGIAVVVAIAVAGPSAVSSAATMADRRTGREEHPVLAQVFGWRSPGVEYQPRDTSAAARAVTRYLDGLSLPAGSVVLDNFDAGSVCTPLVILGSRRPRQFVIPNDRDFQRILADPVTFGARYLFVPKPGDRANLNALNRTYPTLFTSGAGIADLVTEFSHTGCPTFRLYKLRPRPAG